MNRSHGPRLSALLCAVSLLAGCQLVRENASAAAAFTGTK